ncbi:thiopeptide-type bacteriocin biosynthesis protein [Algoriphagus sp. D3-2-R+10]|uniref:thiopeptide-type bacteriocin biosynthesis protein n=1 Tax=Algoriphagus aurantiacus TaxID=3103948 RepID=UPI002B3A8351|nr:thiopeptide-type bacteriocin biosynthesis protein [Algoriphagus sp. D3-2-R+10]MEB2778447.1 thiopeptide-type bacteriocin biosynthesis protein [Algoriphagus sp. D3-2-R+10]
MDFLFRAPLLTIDPRNNEEVEKHWEQILNAISYSSQGFVQTLRGKELKDLSAHQKQKLLKYLLRGRYRATPFGYWAGVGLGNWGSAYSLTDLDTEPILPINTHQSAPNKKEFNTYCLPEGFKKNNHHYVFWSYHDEKEGWLANFIVQSKVVDMVYEWLNEHSFLIFGTFSSWFETEDEGRIKAIWEHLIKSGILITCPATQDNKTGKTIDLKIKNSITIPKEIKNRLEVIPKEMGALFVPVDTTFLETFKAWFIARFDDRFVRMDRVMKHKDFWPGNYDIQSIPPKPSLEISGTFWEMGQELDLSRLIDKMEIGNLRQLQAVFRIGKAEEIQLENFACNYPYAFMGRFGKDPSIHEYFRKTIIDKPEKDTLFADLLLKESGKSQQIGSHLNLFDYSIDSTGGQYGKNILQLNDLWIGVPEGTCVQLYSESQDKKVIPVIQHPLNPSFISHPVSRILWHIAKQDVVRFLPHSHPAFQDSRYTPKLKWGGICLQREKWTIKVEDLKKFGSLSRMKKEWHLPELVTFGNHDRELVLDLNRPSERNIIEKELRSKGKCHISSADWVDQSPTYTRDRTQIYPQIVTGWNFDLPYSKLPKEINFQNKPDGNWIYVRIHLDSSCLDPFMKKGLSSLIKNVEATGAFQRWFFLYYTTKQQEIRVRFQLKDLGSRALLKEGIFKELEESELILSYNFEPYYPEESKFGSGMEISEAIFSLESELILTLLESKVNFNEDAVSIISEIYFRLFWDHAQSDLLFSRLKQIKSTFSVKQKKDLTTTVDLEMLDHFYLFASRYNILLKTHPLWKKDVIPQFLFHHLHLFVNRVFLSRAREMESSVLYQIYKKMGKARAVGFSYLKAEIVYSERAGVSIPDSETNY